MIKLKFYQIMPEDADKLSCLMDGDLLNETKTMLQDHKGVMFGLSADEGKSYTAASAMIFDVGDEILTTALRKLYLKSVYTAENAEHGHDGMMLEYTVNQAAYMGYDYLTVKVSTENLKELRFYAYHGFDKIVSVRENDRSLILQRDIKAKMTCCGLG